MVNIVIPIIRKEITTPKPIQKLIFQLNYRGFYTKEIKYGDIIEIELESINNFMKYVELWRKTHNKNVRMLYYFLVENVEFRSKLKDPRIVGYGSDELLTISLLISKDKADQFTDLFYKAHIRK